MASEHIVRAYDEQLKRLKAEISEMGGLVEVQLGQAIQAVSTRDAELGQRCVASDAKVDTLELQIDDSVVKMLALRQPMASDLRTILSALKIAADLERRILDAIRRGASMEDIADLKDSDVQTPDAAIRDLKDGDRVKPAPEKKKAGTSTS